MTRPVVLLFARAPRLGTVKRRLAAGIGDVAALRFHHNQLRRIIRELRSLHGFETYLAISPGNAKFRSSSGLRVINQSHGDLGQRMHNAFRRFPGRRVILIGADIPGLNATIICAAAQALKHHDTVFGPAADGGYYLIGMGRKRPAAPFSRVRWSSPGALSDTAANFSNHRIAALTTLQDIDTAQDLHFMKFPHCGAV